MKTPAVVRNLRILYPIWFLLGIFSILYVPSVTIDYGDPVSIANAIRDNETLFRLGITGSLLSQLFFIIIPFLLFQLFKNIDRVMATLMLILAVVSVPISMFIESYKLRAMDILDSSGAVMDLLANYNHGLNISTIFWGLWLLPLCWLVMKSGLFPKIIGLVLLVAGLGYVISSFLSIIVPEFTLLNTVCDLMNIGEVVFIFWIVIMGVRRRGEVD